MYLASEFSMSPNFDLESRVEPSISMARLENHCMITFILLTYDCTLTYHIPEFLGV